MARWLLTIALALAWSIACGGAEVPSDSETHFVECKVDDDCAGMGADFVCRQGACEASAGNEPANPPAARGGNLPAGSLSSYDAAVDGDAFVEQTLWGPPRLQ